jgi:hypothetical protein
MTLRHTNIVLALGVGALTVSSACDNSEHTISIVSANSALLATPVNPTAPVSPASPTMGVHQLAIQTSAGAACWIHAQGSPVPAQGRPLYADASGLLRFYLDTVSEQATDRNLFAELDCTAPDGTVLPAQLADPIAAASFAQSASAALEASAPIRPALQGDPNAPSQAALLKSGFPLRPDPSDRANYQHWLQIVSTPFRQLPSATVVHPGVTNTLSTSAYESWAGPVIANYGTQYLYTTGEFNVPIVSGAGLTSFDIPAQLAFWIGLDGQGGAGANEVCQAGTESVITPLGLGAFEWNYYSWIDWAGTGNQFENGLSLATNPGDAMFFNVYVGDAEQNPDINGSYCWTIAFDFTTNQVQTASYGVPSGQPFQGTSAEWIAERPEVCDWWFGWSCAYSPLPDFGTIQMTYPLAFDVNFANHTPVSDSGFMDYMFNNPADWTGSLADSALASGGGVSGDGDPFYYWFAAQ